MGTVVIIIAIAMSILAAVIGLRLIGCPEFMKSQSPSKLSRLTRNSKVQSLVRCFGLFGKAIDRAFAGFLSKCKATSPAFRSGVSALIPRVKSAVGKICLRLCDLLERLGIPGPIGRIRLLFSNSAISDASAATCVQPDLGVLNCRARLERGPKGAPIADVFLIEICGSIDACDNRPDTSLHVAIKDVTGALSGNGAVYAKVKQWKKHDSTEFCYKTELGKLPGRATVLSNWTAVARLSVDWLLFPRQGKRNLKFHTSIVSRGNDTELACAECTLAYTNGKPGYIDLDHNRWRAKSLAVTLAFTVSASDNKLFKCEVDFIKDWARNNVCWSQASGDAKRKLEKALNTTVAFFRDGNKLNTHAICKDIVELAPIADRYDILDFCLHVAQAKGSVAAEELAILSDLADWLEVEADVFRSMSEKILPVNMHEVRDTQVVLGVTSDMSKEKARLYLNKEYSKWNARVTNPDPQIQEQADLMLSLIAEARREYVG